MWMSPKHKARVIYTGETGWKTSVIEVFRWSDEAGGWVHVADVANSDELEKIIKSADRAELIEFSERAT